MILHSLLFVILNFIGRAGRIRCQPGEGDVAQGEWCDSAHGSSTEGVTRIDFEMTCDHERGRWTRQSAAFSILIPQSKHHRWIVGSINRPGPEK